MKRFRLMGVTMVALFAFGAILAASASAATFLLAEWLDGGTAVTTELLTEVTGELLLEDVKLKSAVLCSGVLDGWVGPNSLDYVSEVLTLGGGSVNTTALSASGLSCTPQTGCESGKAATAWAVNLGWETEAELMEDTGGPFLVDLLTSTHGAKTVGWELECTVLLVKDSDECTVTEGVAELTLEGTALLGSFSDGFTELAGLKLAECTLGGAETGVVEGNGTYSASGGGELTASSEGVVS
jgi:hypothetical protein